ncbi:hypothetical protein BDW72DRAFT_187941 [Aspergillus terricola var. indicus]
MPRLSLLVLSSRTESTEIGATFIVGGGQQRGCSQPRPYSACAACAALLFIVTKYVAQSHVYDLRKQHSVAWASNVQGPIYMV